MSERRRLDEWKDIGNYLGVDLRTAQRRAEQGMPVWGKGRRFAYTDQLDFWLENGRRRLEPVTASLSGSSLTAYYDGDRSLWTYRFPEPLRSDVPAQIWRVWVGALVNHPGKCILAACRFQPGSGVAPTGELFCFGNDGDLLWALPAEPGLVDRDANAFPKAWIFTHMVVDPAGPNQAIWMSFANEAGWAGGVLRIDTMGSAMIQFANAGHVEQLAKVDVAGEERVILCGENNDFDLAFVAWFAARGLPAASPPGHRLRYRYANGPVGTPGKYILLPSTELIRARDKPYGHAYHISQYPDDIIVDVETGGEGAYFRYHFSVRLEPSYVFPSGSHEFRHRTCQREGLLDHTWEMCPEVRSPLKLEVWEPGSGWHSEAIRWRDTYPLDY